MFSVSAWMHSYGADSKPLVPQQETIAHGSHAHCLPFRSPALDEIVSPEILRTLSQTLTWLSIFSHFFFVRFFACSVGWIFWLIFSPK